MLSHSSCRVWKADLTPTWSDVTGDLQTGSAAPGCYITGVAASPTIARLYGVALYSTFAVTGNGGVNWTLSSSLGVGASSNQQLDYGAIGAMALPVTTPAGKQPGDVYVAGSSAELLGDGSVVPPTIGHLFITDDRGVTWKRLSGNGSGAELPNVPVWAVKYDPSDASNRSIYVATEIGVYRTVDGGASWQRLGAGLPMARVTDLYLAHDQSFLRVSTWGRGVWELDLTPGAPGPGPMGGQDGGATPPGSGPPTGKGRVPAPGCACAISGDAPLPTSCFLFLLLLSPLLRRRGGVSERCGESSLGGTKDPTRGAEPQPRMASR
jgi:hypothetical protein